MSKAWLIAGVSTFACLVCFAAWMSFDAIGIPVRAEPGFSVTGFGLLTAAPIPRGALLRLTRTSTSLILIFFTKPRRVDFRGRQPAQPAAPALNLPLRQG